MSCVVDSKFVFAPPSPSDLLDTAKANPEFDLHHPQRTMAESQYHPILAIPPDLYTQWCDSISLDSLTRVSKA